MISSGASQSDARARLRTFLEQPVTQRLILGLIIVNALVLGLETSDELMTLYGPLLLSLDAAILFIFVIEIISHLSRVLSLTLRLFGNIFGEHLVVLILASIVPFIAPLPIQFLGLIVGPLQAFIFLVLGAIYLTAATHADDHGDDYKAAPAH